MTVSRRAAPTIPRPLVRIWRIDLTDAQRLDAVAATHLTEAERQRAARGTGAVARRRILLRAGLRHAVGDLLDLPPAEVPLREDDGRPLVAGDGDLRVSCSAGGRVGLVAVVPGRDVGIDVQEHLGEDVRGADDEGWLHPTEVGALRRLPAPARGLAVTRCWVHKEAVLKGLGLGLRRHPATVPTPVAEAGRIGQWWVAPVPVAAGHVAAVALRTPLDGFDALIEDMTVGGTR
jgi:4'-phosphopantetheinyl transferase